MPTAGATRRTAPRSGSASVSVRRLGLDLPGHRRRGGHHATVPDGVAPVRAGRLLLLGWVAWRHRDELRRPTRRELIDTSIVRRCCWAGAWAWSPGASRRSRPASRRWSSRPCPSGWRSSVGSSSASACRLAAFGVVVGFIGVAILVGPTALGQTGALDAAGLAAILAAPIAWSAGSLYAASRAPRRHPLVATGQQMLAGAVVLALMSISTGEPGTFDIAAVSRESLAAFFYLTIVGSVVAFTTFGWMIRVAPLPLVTTYAYVNPVVAVIRARSSWASPSSRGRWWPAPSSSRPSRSSSRAADGWPGHAPWRSRLRQHRPRDLAAPAPSRSTSG